MDEPPGTEYFTIQGTPGPAFMMNNSRMNTGNFVIPGPSYGQNPSSKPMISDKREKYDKSKRMDDGYKYKDYRKEDRGRDRSDNYYYDRNSGSGEENYGDSNSSSRDSYYSRSQDSDYGVKDYESSSRRDYERESRHSRSRSSRDRDRDDRGKSRDRDSSRRERSRDKERSRDRTRSRSRDRDRERDSSRERIRDRDRDRERYDRGRNSASSGMGSGMMSSGGAGDWRVDEIPNQTIMVRGLPSHITEEDLKQEVMRCLNTMPKDIRLLRKKDTGQSRGFAFIEFPLLSEAVRWKELTKGALTFPGSQYKAVLHYSIPKDGGQLMDRAINGRQDWNCVKCGVNNFRRRDYCFKCNSMREDVDTGNFGEGSHEVSATPSNTLLFRNLDVLTTEERVLGVLGSFTALPIKRLKVAKDKLTGTSRGFCFVELHSTAEATQLHDALLSMNESFVIDGREVAISYTRRSLTSMNSAANANAASVALAAAQWTNQEMDCSSTTAQPAQYYQYNNNYNTPNISATSHSSNAVISASSTVVSAPPVPACNASVTQQTNQPNYHRKENKPVFQTKNSSTSSKTAIPAANLGTVVVEGVTYNKYPIPDVSQYQYDKSSGYYYDSTTGLYYDSNSQYYFNSETQQYLYWDGINQTYLVAPVQTPATTTSTDTAVATVATAEVAGTEAAVTEDGKDEKNKPKDKDKQDKVKIAKKIAKDMERWAKTLNQKKENAKLGIPMAQGVPLLPVGNEVPYVNPSVRQSAAADAGFAILEKRSTPLERQALLSEVMMKKEMEDKMGVAVYGDGSDSDNDLDDIGILDAIRAEENKLVDWHKMACLLCKRQFPSAEALKKHQQLSDLHKQNITTLRRSKLSPEEIEELEKRERDTGYRDRAKERREKYGQPDAPKPNRLKDKYLKHLKMQQATTFEEPTKEGIGAENIGNKMLKAMGWSEGQGLGRENQGMAGIIDVTRRVGSAGLGMKGATFGATAKDTYKEAAKKAMHARYMEFDEK